jgi:hypothetical protein
VFPQLEESAVFGARGVSISGLQRAIDASQAGASILVSGTCSENVTIPIGKGGITLDGGGSAAILAADPALPAVLVRARDITVKGFTITGGRGGVVITSVERELSTAMSSATQAFTGSSSVS